MSTSSLLDFLLLAGRLKTIRRTGWVDHGIPNCESVADHSHRIGILALVLSESFQQIINKDHCIKIALVHDLAEAICGDITPAHISGVSSIEKESLELNAMAEISSKLSEFSATAGSEIFNLWKEYDSASSLEAKFVKQLDKLEMLIQAFEYEQQRMGFDLDSFFAWVEQSKKITDPVLMALVVELQSRRDSEKNKSSIV